MCIPRNISRGKPRAESPNQIQTRFRSKAASTAPKETAVKEPLLKEIMSTNQTFIEIIQLGQNPPEHKQFNPVDINQAPIDEARIGKLPTNRKARPSGAASPSSPDTRQYGGYDLTHRRGCASFVRPQCKGIGGICRWDQSSEGTASENFTAYRLRKSLQHLSFDSGCRQQRHSRSDTR